MALTVAVAALLAGCGASLNDQGGLIPAAGGETTGPSAAGLAPIPGASPATPAATPVSLTGNTAVGTAESRDAAAKLAEASKNKAANTYLIGTHDVLEISVFKVPELTKSVQVSDSGTINLPLVGEVPAAGRTAQAVERDLTAKLGGKYLQSPQVTVFVKEFNSQRITVDGSVKKPGVFPYRASVSLLQAIAMADGLDKDSDSSIVVFRNKAGKQEAARFDVSEIREGRQQDPKLEPGDMVIAGSSMIKTVFNNVMKALPVAGFFLGL